MLHAFWSKILQNNRHQCALWHAGIENESQTWTFEELDQQASAIAKAAASEKAPWLAACADQVDYIPTIIAAWQLRVPALLLESQESVVLPIQGKVPPDTVVIKQACGATGQERSLFLSASQVQAECRRNIQGLGLHSGRRGLATISLAHSYGFGCLVLPLLLGAVPLEVLPSPMPVFVRQCLAKGNEVFLPAVPTLWKTWWLTNVLDSSLISLALSAGSPLSCELEMEVWEVTGLKIHNFYGTSETGAIAYDDSVIPREDGSLLGSVLPGVSVTVDTDQRIYVDSDSIATASDHLLSDDEFSKPEYQTMDFGMFVDGRLHWSGHTGAAINVAGRKVSPSKVKRVCESVEGVVYATVTGVKSLDNERFEEVSVHVHAIDSLKLKELKKEVYCQLESWEMPRHWQLSPAEHH